MSSNTAPSMNGGANAYLQVTPSNVLSTGKISFKAGNPVIQFLISPQDRYLIGSSVRFSGLVKFYDSSGNVATSANGLSINPRVGLYGMIDQLTLKAGSGPATGQTLESIRHYNRMIASYLSSTAGFQDSQTNLQEKALTNVNYNLQNDGVVYQNSKQGNSFCLPLPCGMFNGQNPIPLWMTGGIMVEISLSPDNNFLFAEDGTTTAITEGYYELEDVNLLCETMDAPASMKSAISSGQTMSFNYNSIHSYFTTLNSTNAVVNFNLNLKNVLGVFGNFIEASKINNLAFDGMSTLEPTNKSPAGAVSSAKLQKIIWTRGGVKFPYAYDQNFLQKNDDKNDFVDPQVLRGYMNAVTQFANGPGRLQCSPVNTFYGSEEIDKATQSLSFQGGQAFGIGVALDQISDQGVDYSSTPFGINMELDLNTNNPVAFFMYAHARMTMVLSGGGLQIIS
jgi:hypothetical protein